jgi:hypothetical protein
MADGNNNDFEVTTVNPQILDAVTKSNQFVLGSATTEGRGVAYQKVAQATAFAIQDATDYMRNIMAISTAAQGIALQKMVENPATAPAYEPILQFAQAAVLAAQQNFSSIGTAATTVAKEYPAIA